MGGGEAERQQTTVTKDKSMLERLTGDNPCTNADKTLFKHREDLHISYSSRFPHGYRSFMWTEKTYVVKYHICNILFQLFSLWKCHKSLTWVLLNKKTLFFQPVHWTFTLNNFYIEVSKKPQYYGVRNTEIPVGKKQRDQHAGLSPTAFFQHIVQKGPCSVSLNILTCPLPQAVRVEDWSVLITVEFIPFSCYKGCHWK